MRKEFFIMRVVRLWKRFLREAVAAPNLEMFQASLDRTLNNLVMWKVSLPMAEVLQPDPSRVPFKPSPTMLLLMGSRVDDL